MHTLTLYAGGTHSEPQKSAAFHITEGAIQLLAEAQELNG